jgi:hypothetical protein
LPEKYLYKEDFCLRAFTLLLLLVCAPAVCAQDDPSHAQPQPTPLTAPPPFKMIVKEERAQMEQTKEASKRLKLTIEFAVGHSPAPNNTRRAETSKQPRRKSACITR